MEEDHGQANGPGMQGTVGASVLRLAAVDVAVQSSEAMDLRRLFLWVAVAAVLAMTVRHLTVRHLGKGFDGKVRDSAELPARVG